MISEGRKEANVISRVIAQPSLPDWDACLYLQDIVSFATARRRHRQIYGQAINAWNPNSKLASDYKYAKR